MKRRQAVKSVKKVVDILNSINVTEVDFDGDSMIYINAEDTKDTREKVQVICKLLKISYKKIEGRWNELKEFYEGTGEIDILEVFYLASFPKFTNISYSYKNKFQLVKYAFKNYIF